MPSPDLNAYLGLSFFDIDPQDVFEAGAQRLELAMPELVLREGNIETHLLEAVSEEVAETVFAINRIPDGIFESLLKMFGIVRDIGSNPIVNLRFEVNRTDGCVIPAGTAVSFEKPNDLGPITFITIDEVTIPAGETEGYAASIGNQYTSDMNGIPSGTAGNLLDSIVYVDYVATGSVVTGGRDPEDDQSYFSRGVQTLSRLSSTLVLPRHFTSAALEQIYVNRALAIDNYDPIIDPDKNGPTGNDAGHIAVAVYGHGENVSYENKLALSDLLKKQALANLAIHIIDPEIKTFDVTATIHITDGYDPASVVSNAILELKERYSESASDWNAKIRRNDIVAMLNAVPGVSFVDEVTSPASDIDFGGVAVLPKIGNVSIEVSLT